MRDIFVTVAAFMVATIVAVLIIGWCVLMIKLGVRLINFAWGAV